MTKQVSRYDVAKVCESLCSPDVCCPCRDFRHDTAAMLRSLMDELEEATGYWKKLAVMEADARTRAEKAEAQLAAANERAEKAEKQCAYSWVVIANSFGGDWSKASSEWQDMARACEWPRPAEIEELWRGD